MPAPVAVLLALLSAASIGGADFVGGRLAMRTWPVAVVTVAGTVDLVLLGIVSAIVGVDPSRSDIAWAAVGGVVGGVAFAVFLRAMAAGPMSVVSPVTALVGVATPFTAGLVLGERPSTLAWIGCVLGLLAVWLSSATRTAPGAAAAPAPITLVLAAISGLGFGGFVIILEQTSEASGVFPVVVARAVGVVVLAGISLAARRPVLPEPGLRAQALLMGLLQAIATGALILALHEGELTLVGVVSSLYPVTTLLLARGLLGEHLDRLHQLGVAIALVAVVLIAAG